MTIDEAIKQLETYTIPCGKYKAAYGLAIDTMRKYQMMQADYEARLKADLEAVLVELQLEIEGLDLEDVVPEFQDGAECTREYIANMIEEKINSLAESEPHAEKEQTDGK